MTRILAVLEERALIVRIAAPQRRPPAAGLARPPAAATLLREDRRRREAWLAQRLAELTQEERDVLRAAAPDHRPDHPAA